MVQVQHYDDDALHDLSLAVIKLALDDYVGGTPAQHNEAVRFFRSDWFDVMSLGHLDGRLLLKALAQCFPEIPAHCIVTDYKAGKRSDYMRAYHKRRRDMMDAQGRCRDCGRALKVDERPAHYCVDCRRKRSMRAYAQYQRKKALKQHDE